MRAEDTLQYLMDFYGDLYPTRKHALDYLFCVIGNGFEWKNGELMTRCEYLDRWQPRKPIEHAEPSKLISNIYASRLERYNRMKEREDGKKGEASLKRLEFLLNYDPNQKWSPLCEYSKIFNIPDDIKPDWLELVNETKELLKQDGIDIEEEEKKIVEKKKE